MEIVIRAAVIYLFLWAITRIAGRSTLGELSTFQLLLYVTMGDLIQQGVTQQDFSVTGAVLAVSTMVLLTLGVSTVNRRWPRLRPLTHGRPVIIVRDGGIDPRALRAERLSGADLFAAAREQGITTLHDVQLAVLEADGKISFFTGDRVPASDPALSAGPG
jgi:uncharacterized membrane protein YcaP (DUF421 family)